MGWTEIILGISILINWWQYGEQKELEIERDLAMDQARICDEARQDARTIERDNADKREKTENMVRGIVARSELNIRRDVETRDLDSGDTDCAVVVSPAGSKRMEEITSRTSKINKALRPPSTSSDKKRTP